MSTLHRVILASVLALSCLLPQIASAGDKHARALETVSRLLNDAHQTVTTHGAQRLPDAISPYFAFEIWGRFLIQPRKDVFNPKQRHAFRRLLPGFMAHLYHDQFAKGLDRPPQVGGTRKARRDVLVGSTFPRPNGGDLPVEWRVRQTRDGASRVIDIMVGGTSFMLLKREEFTAIVDRDGADGLLDYLRRNAL